MNNIGNRPNLLACDGMQFECEIKGLKANGVIAVCRSSGGDEMRRVFPCQNVISGMTSTELKGFRWSWTVRNGSKTDLDALDITVANFKLLTDEI